MNNLHTTTTSATTKPRTAFTLIEILVSMTIFMILIGITAAMFSSLSKTTSRTIATLDLHQGANRIMSRLELDIKNMFNGSAIGIAFPANIDQDEDGNDDVVMQLTFMYTRRKEQGVRGSFGPFTMAPNKSPHDFSWCVYQSNFNTGILNRGESQAQDKYIFDISSVSSVNINVTQQYRVHGVASYHRAATPQAQLLHFQGTGSTNNFTYSEAWNDDTAAPGSRRRVYQHANFSQNIWSTARHTDYALMHPKDVLFNIRNQTVLGTTFPLSDNAFGVRNQDGLSYNKDYLNVFGSDDTNVVTVNDKTETLYPKQIHSIATDTEYLTFDLRDASGGIIDANTLGDAASIDILGIDHLGRDLSAYNNRPRSIRISFLVHNVTQDIPDLEDLDNDTSTTNLIDALRNKCNALNTFTSSDYLSKIKIRRETMRSLIEAEGYLAFEFHQLITPEL